MLKKSVMLLAATALMLPLSVAEAKERSDRKDRVRAEKVQKASSRQRAERPRARERSQARPRQARADRPRARQQSRQQVRQQARQPTRQQVRQQTRQRSPQRVRAEDRPRRVAPPSRSREQQIDRNRGRQSVVQNTRVRQVSEQQARRDSRRVQQVSRVQSRQQARQQARQQQARQNTRAVRQANRPQSRDYARRRGEAYDSSRRSARRGATRYDYDDASRFNAHRARRDARNARVDRYRDRGSYRYRDTHRRADPYQPHVRRSWRNYYYPRYRTNIFFGFGGYYAGPRFGFGFYDPIWWPYYGGFYGAYNYHTYFGHWPFSRGFYHRRAHWAWAHHHNHYHYGTYCPGFHHDHGHYYGHADYRYTSGDNVAGTLLGAVVGGIIGAEIDGGRNQTAGAVVGAVVGATLGNAATRNDAVGHAPSSGTYQPYSAGARFDADGRHIYETRPYEPPEEIRTCMRYEYVGDTYRCTKWSVEYVYDDQ